MNKLKNWNHKIQWMLLYQTQEKKELSKCSMHINLWPEQHEVIKRHSSVLSRPRYVLEPRLADRSSLPSRRTDVHTNKSL